MVKGKKLNPFHAARLFLYPLKTSENLWFSQDLRGYRKWHEASYSHLDPSSSNKKGRLQK